MRKNDFEVGMLDLYCERKLWVYNGHEEGVKMVNWRVQMHYDRHNQATLPPAFYSDRYSSNMLLVLQRSKPKHILKYISMVGHITMIMKRKRWKRVNSHTGPLFWRAFW